MHQTEKKRAAAEAALEYIEPGCLLGVGTGSTVNYFIDALPQVRDKIDKLVSSSEASSERLRGLGFDVAELAETGDLDLYVDGADVAGGEENGQRGYMLTFVIAYIRVSLSKNNTVLVK